MFVAQAEHEQGQPGGHADPGGAGQRDLEARPHSGAMVAPPSMQLTVMTMLAMVNRKDQRP